MPQLSLPQLAKACRPVFYSFNKSPPALLCLILFCFWLIMAKHGCGELSVVAIPQTHMGGGGLCLFLPGVQAELSNTNKHSLHMLVTLCISLLNF